MGLSALQFLRERGYSTGEPPPIDKKPQEVLNPMK